MSGCSSSFRSLVMLMLMDRTEVMVVRRACERAGNEATAVVGSGSASDSSADKTGSGDSKQEYGRGA